MPELKMVRTIEEKDSFIRASADVTRLVLSCLKGSASSTKCLPRNELCSRPEAIRCEKILSAREGHDLCCDGHFVHGGKSDHLWITGGITEVINAYRSRGGWKETPAIYYSRLILLEH